MSLEEKRALQNQILAEYANLASNLETLVKVLQDMVYNPSNNILDSLRDLEKEVGLVYTLYKASVWAILADLENNQEGKSGMFQDES
ncbi:DASH complex subunit dad3 [Schizosaccharomyces pombe]|uniref:DASH complex subunit dad3 n=1 Tax=Schizosaccharomyces pombe (strain 972 / ATCC 24843) TaxID=284812 RepID=DAD3_SCHPO|nr:DASH complex subunit Dad3 [Schizosaccharomyces pombe]P62505.1 RecName: Full=DASH complex subunit dad3; AltName: Full=Outer kinetochore protein dad3 [Schizosaccharomyces pombe 972h-]CAE46914.1 DASH complex subunit Dad3 [Schizosaccharomyces pombe]|eukprot:NP_001018295.1 DASH complex subunit Dad3 [Schizosaccharomyces pombe]